MKKWFTYKDLKERGFGTQPTVWTRVKNSNFPAPRQFGDGTVKFLASEVEEWENSRPVVPWAPQANETEGQTA